ncbi:MAG TPA: hypothetical protein VGT24_01695 [Candidatus Acidoferrales bacterium]|nr:hypothetical protein [Candidatus Acidoferrales bacterium]
MRINASAKEDEIAVTYSGFTRGIREKEHAYISLNISKKQARKLALQLLALTLEE